MALTKKSDTIINSVLGAGNRIVYEGVRVQAFLGEIEQPLYSNAAGSPAPVVQTDSNGLYEFWIEEGDYVLAFSVGGVEIGRDNYSIFEPVGRTEIVGFVDRAETAADESDENAEEAKTARDQSVAAAQNALNYGNAAIRSGYVAADAETWTAGAWVQVLSSDTGTHASKAGDFGASGGQTPNAGVYQEDASLGLVRKAALESELAADEADRAEIASASAAAAMSSLSKSSTIGQIAPITPTGLLTGTVIFGDAETDGGVIDKFWVNTTSTAAIKMGIYNRVGDTYTPAIQIDLTPVVGSNTFVVGVGGFSPQPISPGQYKGAYFPGNGGYTTNPAYGAGTYAGGGSGAITDSSLTTTSRLEAGFQTSRQTVTATTFSDLATQSDTREQQIDRMSRRLDYDQRLEAVFGDSRAAQEITALSVGNVPSTRGPGEWGAILSNQLIPVTPSLNFGVGGERTDQFLARINSVIRSKSRIVRVPGWINDSIQNIATATTQANILSIVNQLRAAGKLVVLHDDYPGVMTGPQMTAHTATRNYVRSLHAPSQGIAVAYTWDKIATVADGTTPLTNALSDGIHPSPLGAFLEAPAVIAAWQSLGFVDPRVMDALARNYIVNGDMTGTGGSLPAGATGQIADGWTASLGTTGGAAAFTKVTSGGREWQQIAMTGTWAASPSINLLQNENLADFTAGDVVEAYCDFEVVGATVDLRGVMFGVYYQSGNYAGISGYHSPAQAYPTTAFSGRLGTRFMWPAGATRVTPIITLSGSTTTANGTARFTRVKFRKVLP